MTSTRQSTRWTAGPALMVRKQRQDVSPWRWSLAGLDPVAGLGRVADRYYFYSCLRKYLLGWKFELIGHDFEHRAAGRATRNQAHWVLYCRSRNPENK